MMNRKVTPNAPMYSGGPRIQFFARPLNREPSPLTPISEVLTVTTVEHRALVLLAVINICRWAHSLDKESVIPLIKHSLGTPLNRPSPFTELIGDNNADVTVTIGTRYEPNDVRNVHC